MKARPTVMKPKDRDTVGIEFAQENHDAKAIRLVGDRSGGAADVALVGGLADLELHGNDAGAVQEPAAGRAGAGSRPVRHLGRRAAGVGATGQEAERAAARAPFTPLGEEMARQNRPGNGPRKVLVHEINDPLSTLGDPAGFPRLVTFELRAVQITQTPNQVLMLYMFEKR